MYDVIVVGARCAGSPTAMLLARHGHRVLLVDKATFPSDTVSTHIVWPHGVEILGRWGLADALANTNLTPICRRMSFDVGPFALRGTIPSANGGRGGLCPRRTVLDALLVQAAAAAGAEVREGFRVESLLFDGDKVVGVRGRTHSGGVVEERARLIVGADGVHSFVAKAVGAAEYDARPVAGCCYYSYFSGVPLSDMALYVRDGCAFGGVPTNDGLTLVMVNWPARNFSEVRADVDGHVARALSTAPEFAARVRAGGREDAWHGTAGVPNYFRQLHGPGWALAGDAGYCKDPITAQGISDAFLQAEELADAIDAGLSGRRELDTALTAAAAARDSRVRPMYEFTLQLAELDPPPPVLQQLFAALRDDQDRTNDFLSALTGATRIDDFMAPENLSRIVAAHAS